MAATPLATGFMEFGDPNTGKPAACGQVAFYEAGTGSTTKTLKDTWSDRDQTVLNTNPVDLDNLGRHLVYGDGEYDAEVFDRCGVSVEILTGLGYSDNSVPDSALPDLNV